jgi:4-hydroxyphenylacetate 3-monooxygenase
LRPVTRLPSGAAAATKGFAEQCMSEYDIRGWTGPDLADNTDVRLLDTNGD